MEDMSIRGGNMGAPVTKGFNKAAAAAKVVAGYSGFLGSGEGEEGEEDVSSLLLKTLPPPPGGSVGWVLKRTSSEGGKPLRDAPK